MSGCMACLCYGFVHAKDSKVMHDLFCFHASDHLYIVPTRFC